MTRREHNQAALVDCNVLMQWDHTNWMAGIYKDGNWYNPQGLKVARPAKWKYVTLDQMLDEYERQEVWNVSQFGVQS